MLQNEFQQAVEAGAEVPPTRIGDLAAMLQVMRPLNGSLPDPAVGRRQLLADLCRFIGVKVGTLPMESLGITSRDLSVSSLPLPNMAKPSQSPPRPVGELSPRQEQTLRHLLDGNSEKQVARKLELSQHTVHVYVKALYRRFGVSSRAELLARHLKK